MSDTAIILATVKANLSETAKQAQILGTGLQNAAPGEKIKSNNSIQYLFAIADSLSNAIEECEALLQANNDQQKKIQP